MKCGSVVILINDSIVVLAVTQIMLSYDSVIALSNDSVVHLTQIYSRAFITLMLRPNVCYSA